MILRRAVTVAALAAALGAGTALAPADLPAPAGPTAAAAKTCPAGYRHRRDGSYHWCQRLRRNTAFVGRLRTAGGFNGDVWVHAGTAYMGSWGTFGRCPVHGVRAIDVRNPSRPRLLRSFARFRATTSEDVWVGRVETPFFTGDLAAVGIQLCGGARSFRGLALYDVTNPRTPTLLAKLSSGAWTHGVHEVSVVQRADGRVLALASVPNSLLATRGAKGDVRIVEVTNPRRPVELADWDFRRDAPASVRRPVIAARGRAQLLDHSAWPYAGGMRMFASHWDAGEVFLDISDPARPRYLGRTSYRRGEDGNAHSAWFRPDERIFVQNDEDMGPFEGGRRGWGFQRIFDASDPAHPVRVGRFATEDAVPGRDGRIGRDGHYAVHNNVFVGNVQYVSWYSDGVRVVDVTNPARPREIAYFIPPPARDPQGFWVAPDGSTRFPLVWGVYPQGRLVYASDINSGLWIFRVRRL